MVAWIGLRVEALVLVEGKWDSAPRDATAAPAALGPATSARCTRTAGSWTWRFPFAGLPRTGGGMVGGIGWVGGFGEFATGHNVSSDVFATARCELGFQGGVSD